MTVEFRASLLKLAVERQWNEVKPGRNEQYVANQPRRLIDPFHRKVVTLFTTTDERGGDVIIDVVTVDQKTGDESSVPYRFEAGQKPLRVKFGGGNTIIFRHKK